MIIEHSAVIKDAIWMSVTRFRMRYRRLIFAIHPLNIMCKYLIIKWSKTDVKSCGNFYYPLNITKWYQNVENN